MWEDFALFIAVGFLAQIVDGAIGMAYGVTGTSVLLGMGVSPAVASASIHAAEVFTTGMSGFWHWRFRNIRWSFLLRLVIPGMIGGALGAYLLSNIESDLIRPVIYTYLLLMGAWIIFKAWRPVHGDKPPRWLGPLGFVGGFLDAVGGGGWGPMVATSLIGQGSTPRYVIGSVSASEFFVALTISLTFLGTIGLELWPVITGLIVGGAVAAPIAAHITSRLSPRPAMILVGLIVISLSLYGLFG